MKMKTMHLSPEINNKKKFQKPNILRKRQKIPNVRQNFICEASELNQSVISDSNSIHEDVSSSQIQSNQAMGNLSIECSDLDPNNYDSSFELSEYHCDDLTDNMKERNAKNDGSQAHVNIETFFNETPEEKVMLFDYDTGKQVDTVTVLGDESDINNMFIEDNLDLTTDTLSPVDSELQETFIYPSGMVQYKCNVADCKKVFRNEQKFLKHKSSHNEDGTLKPSKQVTVECPVKRVGEDGTEKPCGRIFLARNLLVKHLNEDHTPEDAAYRCEECDRRFFWPTGLRAHVRAHWRRASEASGPVLACGWPGCGRVFRQPCRLREHARAHTGDRPYHCNFPDCRWSFRSASKLMRHARRHTGERRHTCGACGRGFLRREHLRDHHRRHHKWPRTAHACEHPGCEQSFSNISTLYMHMKKVHKNKDKNVAETATTSAKSVDTETVPLAQENEFLVNMEDSSHTNDKEVAIEMVEDENIVEERYVEEEYVEQCKYIEEEGELEEELETENVEDVREVDLEVGIVEEELIHENVGEGQSLEEKEVERAARTHCTWPLSREAATAIIDDDYVEQSENSESNIYTVRSDLFLHGNVLINEDSEQSGGVAVGAGVALDSDLGLLDAHPTNDLMQEELMYTDVASDESSFRIFLLSGEELAL